MTTTPLNEIARDFPHHDGASPEGHHRSPEFLRQLTDEPDRWERLAPQLRLAAALGVRDLYFEARDASDRDAAALVRAAAEVVRRQGGVEVDGLSVAFHPAGRHKALRFMEATALPALWRPFFARPLDHSPHLAAVFADPAEYSFRTFENILPLDRLLPTPKGALTLTPLDARRRGEPDIHRLKLSGDPDVMEALQALDGLGLYVTPLNAASRGGQRFIFHAAELAAALTRALRDCFGRRKVLRGFSHVNPVFRCNHFKPGDAPFASHIDTPYCDPARGHMSRMTLLIYLTGGRGAPALRVRERELTQIAPMTAALFHQRHEHEGRPYEDGPKVFLRTELVFKATPDAIAESPRAGSLFAKACYLTGECVFAPELSRYAHEAYDRSARARWAGLPEEDPARIEAFSHKTFRGVRFVTNGYDYWFNGDLSLPECATLAILDTFNCKLGGEPFRALCDVRVEERPSDGAWVPRELARWRREPGAEPLTAPIDKEGLFPPPEEPEAGVEYPDQIVLEFGGVEDEIDPTRCGAVIDQLRAQQDAARAVVEPAPILLMGQEVFLDPDRFVIDEGTIQVLSATSIAPLNFASFTTIDVEPADSIAHDVLEAPQLLLPPLLYRRLPGGCVHLTLDFFRNTWMVRHKRARAKIPRVNTHTSWWGEDDDDDWDDDDDA